MILSGSARVFLDESNVQIRRVSKADCFSNVGGPHLIHPGLEKNKKPGLKGAPLA